MIVKTDCETDEALHSSSPHSVYMLQCVATVQLQHGSLSRKCDDDERLGSPSSADHRCLEISHEHGSWPAVTPHLALLGNVR